MYAFTALFVRKSLLWTIVYSTLFLKPIIIKLKHSQDYEYSTFYPVCALVYNYMYNEDNF